MEGHSGMDESIGWFARSALGVRWRDWRKAVRMPVIKFIGGLWAVYGLLTAMRDDVFSKTTQSTWHLDVVLRDISFTTWLLFLVAILLLGSVEAIHVLSGSVRALAATTETAESHQAIADFLTDAHEEGVRRFMHVQFMDLNVGKTMTDWDQAYRRWEIEVAAWFAAVRARMVELGCNKQELHAVTDFGSWPFIRFHESDRWSNGKSLLSFRLDRIGEVSTDRLRKAEEVRRSASRTKSPAG
jgi:hypothetical protein